MWEPGGWGDGAPRPYFFLSYAHTPKSDPGDSRDPNAWVYRLYQDLCAHIMEMTTLPAGVPAGFMDRRMHLGEGWEESLLEALAHCRVFVPLYSPRYFRSVMCGREWWAFSQRAVRYRGYDGGRPSGIVPALWVPVPQQSLPDAAARLQFNHSDFGTAYAEEGLYGLMKLGYLRDEYDRAVYRLAQRIVRVAESSRISTGQLGYEFQSMPSAFEQTRELHISVLACHRGDLPPGRSGDCYGDDPVEWRPYLQQPPDRSRPRPQAAQALAEHASRLVPGTYRVTVRQFEEGPAVESGPPTAPELLLLDRWALDDTARRERVARFDSSDTPWISVMVPWNRHDPDSAAHESRLRALTDQTLPRKLREPKPSFQRSRDGIPTLDAFEAELPVALLQAVRGFEANARAYPPKGPHVERPRFAGPPAALPERRQARHPDQHDPDQQHDRGMSAPNPAEGSDDREP